MDRLGRMQQGFDLLQVFSTGEALNAAQSAAGDSEILARRHFLPAWGGTGARWPVEHCWSRWVHMLRGGRGGAILLL